MIASVAAVAIEAPRFAPRPGETLRYRTLEVLDDARSIVRITKTRTLRFDRADDGFLVATVMLTGASVVSSPARKAALETSIGPMTGVPVRIRVDAEGLPGAPVDPAPGWAAYRAARLALGRRIAASPSVRPEIAAAAQAGIAADIAEDARDVRLRDQLEPVLPPPLPPLAIGGSARFVATVPSAGGPLPADGTVTREADGDGTRRYRIAVATAPLPVAPAAARLRAGLPADASPADRARVERLVASLRPARFAETSLLAIDAASGLLRSAEIERRLDTAGEPRQPIARISTTIDGAVDRKPPR